MTSLKKYNGIRQDFHKGITLPIDDEPSGKSWTGFHSIDNNEGFLIVLREYHKNEKEEINTWLPINTSVELTPILGNGKKNKQTVKEN